MRWIPYLTRSVTVSLAALLALSVDRSSASDASPLVLVDEGQPRAVIVLGDDPAPSAREAAAALQKVVRQMTGTELPIQPEGDFSNEGLPILVGMSKLARKTGIDVTQDREKGDHYVIRANQRLIALVGNDDGELRGSAYAVYDLLQRLGCGWYGPDPIWHVVPKRRTLKVPALNVDERPAFLFREESSLGRMDPAVRDAWRLGGWQVAQAHILEQLIPREKHMAAHPDWFGEKQPCLTHPEVVDVVVAQFRQRLDRSKGVIAFSVSSNDALGYCDCRRCRSCGNASRLMLHFANGIARKLAQSHPGRYLLTFHAFWGAHDAPFPELKAEPGVCVMQVNEGNHIQPWSRPERPDISQIIDRNNTRERIAFEGWRRTGAVMAIYEWWIPACDHDVWQVVPWYSGETALENLRWWKRNGVHYILYQTGMEKGTGFPIRWPLYYVGARGMWNPDVTTQQIMNEACQELYGPAAEPMLKFYTTIENAMANSDLLAKSWRLPSPELIYTPKIEAKAIALLDEAAAIKTDDDIQTRIAQERQMWETAKEAMAPLRVRPEGHKPSKQNPGM